MPEKERTGDLGISLPPSPRACLCLLDKHAVPAPVRAHSRVVARLSGRLADELHKAGSEELDRSLIVAAALLHDISKAIPGGPGDHAAAGGDLLRRLGLESVAAIVERHIDLGRWNPAGPVTEEEVVFYCDKRVLHEEVVPLEHRFKDLLERYGSVHAGAVAMISGTRSTALALEGKIFRRLPYGPDRLR
ncbi:HD domain-containing protein [Candidatus Moduliflexota bacterium]